MEKEELIRIAKGLHQEAFDANAYFMIMEQYKDNHQKYYEEMRLSPAFYQVIYEALQKACFMEIAKLYDMHKDVYSIGSLIQLAQNNREFFPEKREEIVKDSEGNEMTMQFAYQHNLKSDEETFFREHVYMQRELYRIFGSESPEDISVSVELTFTEFLDLYYKKFCSLSKKQKNIRMQRNKIYAHNDKTSISDIDKIYEKNPIFYSDIRAMIDFALDVTGLIINALTGVYSATRYSNIDDWEGTLKFVKLGLKYYDYDMKQQEKELMKNLHINDKTE